MNTQRKLLAQRALVVAMASAFLTLGAEAHAQDVSQSSMHIYGAHLMSDPERNEYQKKMHALKTEKAREAFRAEHHERMNARAAARGITLPMEGPGSGMHGPMPAHANPSGPGAGGMGVQK
jgi:hypothetical protein